MGFTKSGFGITIDPIYNLTYLGIKIELKLLSKILSKLKYLCNVDISPTCISFFLQIYEGTAQIQRLIIAREHVGRYKN